MSQAFPGQRAHRIEIEFGGRARIAGNIQGSAHNADQLDFLLKELLILLQEKGKIGKRAEGDVDDRAIVLLLQQL